MSVVPLIGTDGRIVGWRFFICRFFFFFFSSSAVSKPLLDDALGRERLALHERG